MSAPRKPTTVGQSPTLLRKPSRARPFVERGVLCYKLKRPDGSWYKVRTAFKPGQEEDAIAEREAAQRVLEAEATANAKLLAGEVPRDGHTVLTYSSIFLKNRGKDVETDERRLKLHVYPAIGKMRLRDVEARHVQAMIDACKEKGLAPRTILNVYAVTQALFRDAAVDGLIGATPCILSRNSPRQLPKPRDADPQWRDQNFYTREELELLASPHPFIEVDSMVSYAIFALTGIREGECGRLRWEHWDEVWHGAGGSAKDKDAARCLGRLKLWDTKTGDPRFVPVHPELAAVLKAWRDWGWKKYTGQDPKPSDFIVPRIVGAKSRQVEGAGRSLETFKERMMKHRDALGWRHGRLLHTIRHSFISQAKSARCDMSIIRRGTHKVERSVMEMYTRTDWALLCEEWQRVPLTRSVAHGVLGTWDRLPSIFPAPNEGQTGPGRKRNGRYVKGQRPTRRDGSLLRTPRKAAV